MAYWVYLIACYKKGKVSCYYTGQTNDIGRRRKEHIQNVVEGKTNHFTGRFEYCKMVWTYKVNSRQEALELEQEIKDLDFEDKEDLAYKRVELDELIDIEEDDY